MEKPQMLKQFTIDRIAMIKRQGSCYVLLVESDKIVSVEIIEIRISEEIAK